MMSENFCIQKIKRLMTINGFTPYQLSKKSGVPLSTINSMLKKNTYPRIDTLEKICTACGITLSQFFTDRSSAFTLEQEKLVYYYNGLNQVKKYAAMQFIKFLYNNKG